MNSRRLLAACLIVPGIAAVGGAMLTSGCSSEESRPHRRIEIVPSNLEPHAQADPHPPTQSQPPSTVDAVTQRTLATAQTMENAPVARHLMPTPGAPTSAALASAAPAAPTAAAAPAPQASPVEWLTPEPLVLSNLPKQPRPMPQDATPVAAAPPDDARADASIGAANQPTQIRPPASAAAPPSPTAGMPPEASSYVEPSRAVLLASSPIDADSVSRRVTQRMHDAPSDLASHLDNELYRLIQDDQVPQYETMATLQSEDRELLNAMMDGLSLFRRQIRADRNLRMSAKIKPLVDMIDRVRAAADLSIPTIQLCSSVKGFGVYDPMPSDLRGRGQPADHLLRGPELLVAAQRQTNVGDEVEPGGGPLYRDRHDRLARQERHPDRSLPQPPPRFFRGEEDHPPQVTRRRQL